MPAPGWGPEGGCRPVNRSMLALPVNLAAFAGAPAPQPRIDILRLKCSGGLSHEAIACSLGCSMGVVAKYLSLAGAAGLDWQATVELDEAALERRLLGRSAIEARVVEADFARVQVELRRKGVTLMRLWQEYRAAFERRRTWANTQSAVLRALQGQRPRP